jgi:hypothetical protein
MRPQYSEETAVDLIAIVGCMILLYAAATAQLEAAINVVSIIVTPLVGIMILCGLTWSSFFSHSPPPADAALRSPPRRLCRSTDGSQIAIRSTSASVI